MKTHKISCEGITSNSTVSLIFGQAKEIERKDYLWHYCCREYESCAQYQAIMRKYE